MVGTRFDFAYNPVGEDQAPRFYTAVLFVTDKHRVVMGVAGREEHRARYSKEVDTIVGDLEVRGCKVASKICKGPQPERLSTPAPAPSETKSEAKSDTEPAAKDEAPPSTEAAPAK